jgi:hypothetical protein
MDFEENFWYRKAYCTRPARATTLTALSNSIVEVSNLLPGTLKVAEKPGVKLGI